ncbi:hypothetical protein NAEGRDRAFT_30052 [Naegleria gruberi]|uniref:Actin n=1 Tax=Naegleria gruberi TaxID=5762 RepID=D2V093_NAEGR|nr:uncharacterized protein NAEGRDRAFT_30052 [Naegleria gruberi]EFC49487.1 hypothetical protein NAEGRDRAFT_30052 [Naegleria gruberi]|eukprot:XP_002682231.1 hypothetical protein NAEGRDRAFT_30052 [Naegleria gruberi strain NEG-M]
MSPPIVVIDCGSTMCKAGFAGEEAPISTFPSVVEYRKTKSIMLNQRERVGDRVFSQIGVTWAKLPIERGTIVDWDGMEKVWYYTFHDELRVDPESNGVLLTESVLNDDTAREKTTQIMFEKFNVPSLNLENQAVLSLVACDCQTGVVLESGGGITQSVPIYEGRAIKDAVSRLELGGEDLSDLLHQILNEKGKKVNTNERQMSAEIKKSCYVALDFEEELKQFDSKDYELPDGNMITIESERFRCPEVLFHPESIGMDVGGIHEMIFNSIGMCNLELRPDLFNNVVLSGGNTMFEGIGKRLQKELCSLAPVSMNIKVTAPPERHCLSWIGGSIMMASSASQQQNFISKQEYDDIGASIVHRNYC